MSVDLILVHSGNKFPFYINNTIRLAKKYISNIHIIIDQQFIDFIEDKSCIIVPSNNLEDFRYQTYNIKNYDTKFRDNFFTRTSSRFILLDNYITKNNISSCFHIENDIAVFSDLQEIKIKLDQTIYDTAIIMDHPRRCVPSIIWLKNNISSKRLANFIYDYNTLDDMKNLAQYFLQNRNLVINLPIIPFNLIDRDSNINFGNYFNIFDSIFDGAAIGQYLYGIHTEDIDKNTSGFINETSVFKPNQYLISFKNKEPYIKYDNKQIKINNLHIHSKKIEQLC